jgi:2-keto-4-pentenoate hydratase
MDYMIQSKQFKCQLYLQAVTISDVTTNIGPAPGTEQVQWAPIALQECYLKYSSQSRSPIKRQMEALEEK